jgi:hypothetical protein
MYIIGYDPGGRTSNNGKGANGIAVVEYDSNSIRVTKIETHQSVLGVWNFIKDEVKEINLIDAIGIDAPMSHNRCKDGYRPVEKYLLNKYNNNGKKYLIQINSLRGSVLINGILLAKKLLDVSNNEDLIINETHPSLTYYLVHGKCYNNKNNNVNVEAKKRLLMRLPKLCNCDVEQIDNDHECDALFSAYITWLGIIGECEDLTTRPDLIPVSDPLPEILPQKKVTFYWPKNKL